MAGVAVMRTIADLIRARQQAIDVFLRAKDAHREAQRLADAAHSHAKRCEQAVRQTAQAIAAARQTQQARQRGLVR